MRVRIDAARHDVAAGGVEHVIGGVLQVLADLDDLAVLDEDVGLVGDVGGDDRAVLDEFGHLASLPRPLRQRTSSCPRLVRAIRFGEGAPEASR